MTDQWSAKGWGCIASRHLERPSRTSRGTSENSHFPANDGWWSGTIQNSPATKANLLKKNYRLTCVWEKNRRSASEDLILPRSLSKNLILLRVGQRSGQPDTLTDRRRSRQMMDKHGQVIHYIYKGKRKWRNKNDWNRRKRKIKIENEEKENKMI